MEIINKIIKSTKEPRNTSVLWANPETREYLYYSNNGWLTLNIGGSLGTEPAPNEIWYTTSNNLKISLIEKSEWGWAFGANVVKHTYKDGLGVIKFDAPISDAFFPYGGFQSLILPEGLPQYTYFELDIKVLTIPKSVKVINYWGAYNAVEYIIYKGTKEEWVQIQHSPEPFICPTECSDGIISKETRVKYKTESGDPIIPFYNYCLGSINSGNLNSVYDGEFYYFDTYRVEEILGCYDLWLECDGYACWWEYAYHNIGYSDTRFWENPGRIKRNDISVISLPETVTYINSYAFFGCTSIKILYCHAITPPLLDSKGLLPYATIYVPAESVEAYKTATNWSYYSSKIQAIPS